MEPERLRVNDRACDIVATATLARIEGLHSWFEESGLFKNGDRVLLVQGEGFDEYRLFGWNFSYGFEESTYVDIERIERTVDS